MEIIIEFMNTDLFKMIVSGGIIVLFILYLINIIKLSTLKKNYKSFMQKIGNGDDIQSTIEGYMQAIKKVEKDNQVIKNYCDKLDANVARCVQKIGLVRYNAFKDTGSDLSFALALLNEENTGIVLNGIYSREMSNIYAKPVEKGISTYTLSDEEKEAIKKAINN